MKNPGEEEREKEGHRLCAHVREQKGGLQMKNHLEVAVTDSRLFLYVFSLTDTELCDIFMHLYELRWT